MLDNRTIKGSVFPFLMESKNYQFGDFYLEHIDKINKKNNKIENYISISKIIEDNIVIGEKNDRVFIMDIPLQRLINIIVRKEGQITIDGFKFVLPKKKKFESYVHFDIYQKTSNKTKPVIYELKYTTGNVWSPHHNTEQWEMLLPFLFKEESICSISISHRLKEIGINIFTVKEENKKNKYPLSSKSYTYSISLNNISSHITQFLEIIDLYTKETNKRILTQSTDEINKYIGNKLKTNIIYNFDNHFYKKDLLKISIKDYIPQELKFYDDMPFNINSNLVRLYINQKNSHIDEHYNIDDLIEKEYSIIDKYKIAIKKYYKDQENITLPMNKKISTKYSKEIYLLDEKYITKENEDDLIKLVNFDGQLNYKWGNEVNMLPIEHILYYSIEKELINVIYHIKTNLMNIRNKENIFPISSNKNLLFLIKAFDTNNIEIIELILNLYIFNSTISKQTYLSINYEKMDFIEQLNFVNIVNTLNNDKLKNKILNYLKNN
jgi:hypothetical protein